MLPLYHFSATLREMKPGSLLKLYALILLVIFGGIVVHAPLSVGVGALLPSADLLIKSWKEILLLIAASLTLGLVSKKEWKELLHDRIFQCILLYALLHSMTAAALLTGPLATMAGLAIDLRYILFFALVYILIQKAPEYRQYFLRVGAAGAVVVVGFAVLQLLLPVDILSHIGYSEDTIKPYLTVDENPDFVRVNSTMRGPNPLGAYVVVVIGLLVAAVVRGRVNLKDRKLAALTGFAAVMSGIALWVSYSRSALGAGALTAFLAVVVAARHLVSRRAWIAGCIVLFALAGGIILGRDSSFVAHVLFHENPADENMVNSNDGHIESLIDGTERMLQQPIGGGIGSTGSASLMTESPLIIENQYLFIAHEVGWLGLGLFVALMALILLRLWQYRRDWLSLGVFASGIGLACIGLLLPVWVDDTVSIIWWGLAAVALATGGKYGK